MVIYINRLIDWQVCDKKYQAKKEKAKRKEKKEK